MVIVSGLKAHFLFAVGMMRKAPAELDKLIHTSVAAIGYELVGVEMLGQGGPNITLRVYIDHTQGITVDDCSKVSHQLSGILDVADLIPGRYDLEISSPGLDRPLFKMEHFERFTGHKVRILLLKSLSIQGKRKFSGTLAGVDSNQVLMMDDDNIYRIPFEQIEIARLVPNFRVA